MRDRQARAELRAAVVLGTLAAGLMLGQTVFAKATRDALFLANFPVQALPRLIVGAAVLSLVAMLASSRALARFGPARVVPVAFVGSAALYVAEWLLARPWPAIAAVSVYLHLAILSAIVSSAFWSLVNERFDPHTARRVFGRIAGGGTAGAVLGGLGAWQLGSRLPLSAMLAVLATLNLVCAVFVRRLARTASAAAASASEEAVAGPAPSGLAVLREVPYLRQLGLLVALVALLESQLDYVLKDAASDLVGAGRLVTFFALFHAGAGLLSFLLQSTLSRPALDKLGLAGTVALLPGLVVLMGFVRLVVPSLWTSVALAGLDAVLSTSLYRAGYELMYTPLAKLKKRPTKTIIDVGLDRLGTTAGAGATMLVLFLVPTDPTRFIVAIAIAAGLAALFVGIRLHEGYVAALADSLRTGAVKLEPDELYDAASRRTLAETHVELSRQKLLEEVGRLRESLAGRPDGESREATVLDAADPLVADITALRSADPARARRVLSRPGPLPPELVAVVLPLLGRHETAREAAAALRRALPRATGQLLDVLLDPQAPPTLRRRLPRVLAGVPSARVVDGLMRALADPIFEVRYRVAMSLLRATETDAALRPPREVVLAAASREIDATVTDGGRAGHPLADPEDDSDASLVDVDLRAHVDRRLECVFSILCLTLDREPLRIAFRALTTRDEGLRGTALEYLDNVLPEPLRDRMRPLLGERRSAPRPPRTEHQVAEELLHSAESIAISLDALRLSPPGPPKP